LLFVSSHIVHHQHRNKPQLALSGEHALEKEIGEMSKDSKGSGDGVDLGALIKLFGSPPLLGNEKLEHFEEMMNRFIACMRPEDFVMSVFVYQVGIETWCTMRWKRYQALMINRWERTAREFEAQRAKLKERRKAEQADPPELMKGAEDEVMRREALVPSIYRVYEDCKTAIESAEEIDLVVAFERGINTLQKVEPFISEALKRRNDAFRQIEWYRVSLAQDLRKEADAIIEGECKEIKTTVDAVPLIPGNEQSS
jgi:hypothetical protein